PTWGTHEDRFEGAFGLDSEVPQTDVNGAGCPPGTRYFTADCHRARTGDYHRQSSQRPCPYVCTVQAASGHQQDRAVAQRDQLAPDGARISSSAQGVLGSALVGTRLFGGQLREYYR